MKTKLIELAKEVGFGAVLMQNVAYKAYPDLEPTRYYLWMCELQKWCRERYSLDLYMTTTPTFEGMESHRSKYKIVIGYTFQPFKWTTGKYYLGNTYEQALEEGLYQTLLLIQEENGVDD